MRTLRLLPLAFVLCALAACDGGNITGSEPAAQPTRAIERVVEPPVAEPGISDGNGTMGSGNLS